MNWEKIAKELSVRTPTKIVLLVLDGLGGLPVRGKTELESARTPHLDALAREGCCGLTDPVYRGITPGSGPAHLSLFGYDPLVHLLGRGILEALGIGISVGKNDLVARGNFATEKEGLIVDRRAGRIPTSENEELCRKINSSLAQRENTHIELHPGKEHRFVVKFSGNGLQDALSDADPQKENKPYVYTKALLPEAESAAELVNTFIDDVSAILKDQSRANAVLLRGFSKYPNLPTMQELYGLTPAAVATYPMYKGLARLVGMEILDVGPEIQDLFAALEKSYSDFDFFYIHIKKTDSAGEDGDYKGKVAAIEEADLQIPRILSLKPDVFAVTSDHSTPSLMKGHSWHPNPILIHAPTAQTDAVKAFTEVECSQGYLGRFEAFQTMPLLLAHAGKLKKYGA
jgi:2,3-bisphosphoglycerate-independent phosphoglycerate mutase